LTQNTEIILNSEYHQQAVIALCKGSYMQELAELSIADGSLLIFTEIQFHETSIHIKRNFVVQDCLLHHLRELI
jgi:hypothetical protein